MRAPDALFACRAGHQRQGGYSREHGATLSRVRRVASICKKLQSNQMFRSFSPNFGFFDDFAGAERERVFLRFSSPLSLGPPVTDPSDRASLARLAVDSAWT